MAQLMRTSNPVLNEKRFEGVAELGERDDARGHGQQDRPASAFRDGLRSLDMASV